MFHVKHYFLLLKKGAEKRRPILAGADLGDFRDFCPRCKFINNLVLIKKNKIRRSQL